MREEWKLFIGWIVLVILLLLSGCASSTPQTLDDDKKKSTPRCCVGQDKHTCGMPGMPPKPEPR